MSVLAFLGVDIWETIFNHLALLGYLKTLASCALLSKEHARPALQRLYSHQFVLPCSDWVTPAARGLWESLIFSIPFNIYEQTVRPLTSHPYLTYIRRLDIHSLLSVLSRLNWSELRLFASALARHHHNPHLTKMNSFMNLPGAHAENQSLVPPPPPPIRWRPENLALRLVEGLVRFSQRQGLRVVLKELTAETWSELVPIIFSCHELESLSLDFVSGLNDDTAHVVNTRLPKLRNWALVEANPALADDLASFIAHLHDDHLLSFKCSLESTQLPVLQALIKHTKLREVELQFFFRPPLELHTLTPLTNLTSLTLKYNYTNAGLNFAGKIRTWAETHRATMVNWLRACKNLKSLHIFRMPFLVPAITDALKHLRLDRLHVYETRGYMRFYRALKTQRLKYLFIGEWPHTSLMTHAEERRCKEREWHVVEAVCAMPCLRDLRLHTSFALAHHQLQEIAAYVLKLETISFPCSPGEDPAQTLRVLENFKHLTCLTVLGLTMFSGRDILQWIQRTQCHLRPGAGGFSLSLPSQSRRSWFRGVPIADYPLRRDPAADSNTLRIRELLRFFRVWVRGQSGDGDSWTGNGYECAEEGMFINLWGEVEGSIAALMVVKGSILYPPYSELTEDMGFRLA